MSPVSFFLAWRRLVGRAALAGGLLLSAVSGAAAPDNETLEKALQGLSWDQFRAVVIAVPKLKADVDAYGPLGWQYVQANYKSYPWRKNIRKLQGPQKERLAELIDEARAGTLKTAE